MPPKKPPQNAFFFFMKDFRSREEARGRVFPGGWKDVSAACGDEWATMTPQQKGTYEARAKSAKVKNGQTAVKYTSQGVPIALIEKEEKRKQDFEDTMNDYIKATVSVPQSKDSLISKKFYFIHVNWLCRKLLPNNDNDFIPVEFAVVEFSLKYGVQNTYHEIINIDVPMGYTFDAALHAEETHKIGKDQISCGQKNFLVMFENLKAFMKPETIGDELPPLYTTAGVAEIVPGLLSRMAKSAGRSVDLFRVYSIETLFFHIRNASAALADGENTQNGFPALSLAYEEIKKDRFDRASGIACEYHTEMEESSVHCSRSIVVRWAYTVCDFCCLDLGIEMLPEIHCPLDTDVDSMIVFREKAQKEALELRSSVLRGLASMTGVTEEYRQKTSERTYRQEQERKLYSRPLQIIDHSMLRNSAAPQIKNEPQPSISGPSYSNCVRPKHDAPLRAPRTQMRKSKSRADAACPYSRSASSYAMMGVEKVPDLGESNFPAIGGRGAGIRQKIEKTFPSIGRGRGLSYGSSQT